MAVEEIGNPGIGDGDAERYRRDFPCLRQEAHGRPLVYLDSAATSQKPQAVIDAVSRFYETSYSNVHRGAHMLSERATDAFEGARSRIASFINAADAREIVFVRGATEAINLVAASYGRANFGSGDEILLTEMEHHSNIVPWQLVAEQTGATLKVVPISDDGELMMERFDELLGPRTKMVGVTHVSNALGTIIRSRRSPPRPTPTAPRCWWTAARRRRGWRWTSRIWTATSMPSRATSSTVPAASACSTASATCSRPCRPTRAAAR